MAIAELEAESQGKQILAYMMEGKPITPLQALRKFGCLRLGARIWDLRHEGYAIGREWDGDGHKRWARYSLIRKRKRKAV